MKPMTFSSSKRGCRRYSIATIGVVLIHPVIPKDPNFCILLSSVIAFEAVSSCTIHHQKCITDYICDVSPIYHNCSKSSWLPCVLLGNILVGLGFKNTFTKTIFFAALFVLFRLCCKYNKMNMKGVCELLLLYKPN